MDDATVNGTLTDVDAAVGEAGDLAGIIDRLLAVGTERLDVDDAYLARIDAEHGYWSIQASVDGELDTDRVLDLEDTYCRETIESGRLVIADAATEGWAGTAPLGHATYLGHRIDRVGGVGTVCFVAEDPRERPFTAEERLIAETLARRIEFESIREEMGDRIGHLENFVSLISHDLRNPLTVARGWVEAEQMSTESDGLDRAMTALSRIEGLIEAGVTLARAAQPVDDRGRVSLATVAQSPWRGIAPKDASLTVEGDLRFLADETRVRTVFEPLYQNAVDHGGDGVSVRVGPRTAGDGFFVADDGPGIDREIRDRVFEPGFSVDGEGNGFGLAMARATANAHGWSIDVDEDETGGARFSVRDVVVVPN